MKWWKYLLWIPIELIFASAIEYLTMRLEMGGAYNQGIDPNFYFPVISLTMFMILATVSVVTIIVMIVLAVKAKFRQDEENL